MADPSPEPCLSSGEENAGGDPTIREMAATVPMPDGPTSYDTAEADFWRVWRIPVGSVVTYTADGAFPEASGIVAVLVTRSESVADGVWMEVRPVGCSDEQLRPKLGQSYKAGRKRHHICYPDSRGECPIVEERGVHLSKFRWYPAGSFTAPWMTRQGLKKVEEGKQLMEASPNSMKSTRESRRSGHKEPGDTRVEKRLDRLKERSRQRVSFAPTHSIVPPLGPAELRGDTSRAGALRRPSRSSSPLALTDRPARVKQEVMVVDSDQEKERATHKKKTSPRSHGIADALASAVAARHSRKVKEENKKRSRSRSPRRSSKRKKGKSRRRSGSGGSSSSSGSGESSSDSLVPPLKKRSKRDPGSVYKLLVSQATEQLAQEGLTEDAWMTDTSNQQKIKIYTYFQLALKPNLDPRARDTKELGLLARALDLLQQGDLPLLADLLAARLIAVETATRQGWGAAKYLELQAGEDDGTAPAHILLAAQRHSRQVEKAGGKGSWSRSQQWQGDWQPELNRKGKGKGTKGKKGKGKNKGGKAPWSGWGSGDKEKPGESKPTKGDA